MLKLRLLTRSSRCICRAEFCYVCGAKWRTCKCGENILDHPDEFDDRRWEEMLASAVEHVERIYEDGRIEWRVPAAGVGEGGGIRSGR